jgi:hypothetical protein
MRGLLLVLLAVAVLAGCVGGDDDSVDDADRERAIAEAQRIYEEMKATGTDFSSGPCISEEVIDDWAADVAHDPRQDIDNQPENQCRSYRDGETHHFVELDPDGNLIRAK